MSGIFKGWFGGNPKGARVAPYTTQVGDVTITTEMAKDEDEAWEYDEWKTVTDGSEEHDGDPYWYRSELDAMMGHVNLVFDIADEQGLPAEDFMDRAEELSGQHTEKHGDFTIKAVPIFGHSALPMWRFFVTGPDGRRTSVGTVRDSDDLREMHKNVVMRIDMEFQPELDAKESLKILHARGVPGQIKHQIGEFTVSTIPMPNGNYNTNVTGIGKYLDEYGKFYEKRYPGGDFGTSNTELMSKLKHMEAIQLVAGLQAADYRAQMRKRKAGGDDLNEGSTKEQRMSDAQMAAALEASLGDVHAAFRLLST